MTQLPRKYTCALEVRGYELDSYKHVNHANYLNYLEHARWKLLEQEGISLRKLDEWQRWPVIAEIHAHYLKPTYMGQSLEVETTFVEHGRTWFTLDQVVRAVESGSKTDVFKARVRAVMVNEKGRPSQPPVEISKLWGPSS